MASETEQCPVCNGDGDIGNTECHFCDGYGFLYIKCQEDDTTEYSTYYTYLRCVEKHFKHSTQEIVVEGGSSFFDEEPKPNKYIKIPAS